MGTWMQLSNQHHLSQVTFIIASKEKKHQLPHLMLNGKMLFMGILQASRQE